MSALHPAPPRHAMPVRTLRIAVLSGRSDTDLAELGRRLSGRAHEVVVHGGSTAAAVARSLARRADVAVLPAEAAAAIPLLRARGTAVAVHVTGGGAGARRAALPASTRFAIREADALVTDLQLVADEVARSGVPAELIRPGADRRAAAGTHRVAAAGLVPGAYHLAVGDEGLAALIRAHRRSATRLPLVVLGARTPIAAPDGRRIRVIAGPTDDATAAQLRAHALTSLHAGAAGGTDRGLIAAMAAGAAILARDTPAHRELAGTAGFYAMDESAFARHMEDAERYPQRFRDIGELMTERAASRFDWDRAAEAWDALASRLARGYSSRGLSSAHRGPTAR